MDSEPHPFRWRVRMPTGRHFAVTWTIPDDFGGMTEAIFRRSRAFDRFGGVAVDVLTFDARPDYPGLEATLRGQGALSAGVRIVNLYDWLREHPLPAAGDATPADAQVFTPIDEGAEVEERTRDGRAMSRVRRDAEGAVLQVDHLRADGTVVVSDRRDVRQEGTVGGRCVVLCDRRGRPVWAWRRIWGLYAAWLDALTDGARSYMIVDSKTIARFMLTYQRPHVVTAHLVHGSHHDKAGNLRASRREVLTKPGRFDVLAVLSRRQAHDIRRQLGAMPNLVVVRNGRGGLPPPSRATRDRGRAVVVAGLTRRKRVSHAIAAVQAVNAGGAGPVTLDVYGEGDTRKALERRIGDDPLIRLRGHDPRVRERLHEASFLLLTSHSEGFPLALVEAMSAGCLPIAYDVEYGPSDIIRHGRNGLIVPPGDVDALVRAVRTLLALPERDIRTMRRRAIRSVRRFRDVEVTRRWAILLESARARKELRRRAAMPRARAAIRRSATARTLASSALRVAARLRQWRLWRA